MYLGGRQSHSAPGPESAVGGIVAVVRGGVGGGQRGVAGAAGYSGAAEPVVGPAVHQRRRRADQGGSGASGLRGGRLERPEIPEPRCTTPGADQAIVKDNDLNEGEVPHLGQTPVQFAVLGQYPPGRVFEIGGRLGDEIPNGGGKLVDRNVEALRGLTELTLGVVG